MAPLLLTIVTNRQQLNANEQNFEQLNSEMKTQSENYQRELLEITRIKEKLESILEKEIKQRTELEARNEQLAALSEEKQMEMDNVREVLRSKEEAIENLTHDMEITRTSHLNKEAQLTSANDHIQALSTQMVAMEEAHKSEVERLEIETRERLDQLGSAGEEMGRLQAELAELRAKLEEKEEMRKDHLEAIKSSKAEHNRASEELKSKVETTEKKLVEVEVRLEEEQKQSQQFLEDNMQQKANLEKLHHESAAARENSEVLLRETEAKLKASVEEAVELNGQISAYAEELRGTKEQEAEQNQKLQTCTTEIAGLTELVEELKAEKARIEELLRNVQETKDAQDTSFEALKSRASNVSLEHVAAMEKARLLEENNTRLQEEMDKVLEERRAVDEMLISMGSKEQELKLELLQERETVKELSDNWDKRKVEIETLENEKMELKAAMVSLEKRLGEE